MSRTPDQITSLFAQLGKHLATLHAEMDPLCNQPQHEPPNDPINALYAIEQSLNTIQLLLAQLATRPPWDE